MRFELGTVVSGFPPIFPSKGVLGGAGAGCQGSPELIESPIDSNQPCDSRQNRRGALLLGGGAGSPLARRLAAKGRRGAGRVGRVASRSARPTRA